MLATSIAVDFDIGLLVTFLGIGLIANALIAYSAAQAAAERRENSRLRDEGYLE